MENKLRKRAFMELKLDYDTSIIFAACLVYLESVSDYIKANSIYWTLFDRENIFLDIKSQTKIEIWSQMW